VDDFRAMLDVIVIRREVGQGSDALAVRRDDKCFAYLVMNISKKHDSEELVCRIYEYAGSRLAIISAIKNLFEKHNISELSVGALPQDTEFLYILAALSLEPSVGVLAGTMRIINFEKLMEDFAPYLQQRLGRKTAGYLQFKTDDGKHLFQIADERFIIENEANLVQLMLGAPDDAELKIMPSEGELAEVLREVLPLPFVWPGLNCV